jgi:hypothetical protein
MPTHSLLRDTRYTIIPHQLRGVADGLVAIDLEAEAASDFTPYTRPVICVAAFHCRTLLRFLGLQDDGSLIVRGRHDVTDGVWIGDFHAQDGVSLTGPNACVTEEFADASHVARAWAATSGFATQNLAHAIKDARLANGTIQPLMRRTFETIPTVISRYFYERAVLEFTSAE